MGSGSNLNLDDGTFVSPAKNDWVYGDYSLHDIHDADPVPDGKHAVGSTVEHVGGIWKYIYQLEDIVPLTPEEYRAQMPRKSMVEFRAALRSVKVVQREGEAELDGIYESDILDKISLIADRSLQAEARDYFLYVDYIDRSNPWVDILGVMTGLSREEIDTAWVG